MERKLHLSGRHRGQRNMKKAKNVEGSMLTLLTGIQKREKEMEMEERKAEHGAWPGYGFRGNLISGSVCQDRNAPGQKQKWLILKRERTRRNRSRLSS